MCLLTMVNLQKYFATLAADTAPHERDLIVMLAANLAGGANYTAKIDWQLLQFLGLILVFLIQC